LLGLCDESGALKWELFLGSESVILKLINFPW
jgi:hypothetical protein